MQSLAAFTSSDAPYPSYISIVLTDAQQVEITVRSPAGSGETCGSCGKIVLDPEQFITLVVTARSALFLTQLAPYEPIVESATKDAPQVTIRAQIPGTK